MNRAYRVRRPTYSFAHLDLVDTIKHRAVLSNSGNSIEYSTPSNVLFTRVKGKKVHTLDIAPFRSESPPQKRSEVKK